MTYVDTITEAKADFIRALAAGSAAHAEADRLWASDDDAVTGVQVNDAAKAENYWAARVRAAASLLGGENADGIWDDCQASGYSGGQFHKVKEAV